MLRKIDWESQIGRRLKLRDLYVFLTAVQRGSMAKAAQELGVSQPAVSEVIADLEHALGVRLVDRNARGIEPTIYGVTLLKRTLAAFDELKQGIKDIEFLSDQTAGEVRIAAPPALATGFAAVVIDRLARQHPRIVCHFAVVDTTYRALEAREVDLMIAMMVEPIAEDQIEAELLYDDLRFVVAATKNPWSRRRALTLADLVSEPWTLPPPASPAGAAVAQSFRAAGLDPPNPTVVSPSGAARVALVAEGRFLTIAAESIFRFAGRDMGVKALPIKLPGIRRPVVILTLKNRTLTRVAQTFIECARQVASQLKNKSASR
jgi:DNA-binding transcriptional LysR family regulator